MSRRPTEVRQLISQQVTVGAEPLGALQVQALLQGMITDPGSRSQLRHSRLIPEALQEETAHLTSVCVCVCAHTCLPDSDTG